MNSCLSHVTDITSPCSRCFQIPVSYPEQQYPCYFAMNSPSQIERLRIKGGRILRHYTNVFKNEDHSKYIPNLILYDSRQTLRIDHQMVKYQSHPNCLIKANRSRSSKKSSDPICFLRSPYPYNLKTVFSIPKVEYSSTPVITTTPNFLNLLISSTHPTF